MADGWETQHQGTRDKLSRALARQALAMGAPLSHQLNMLYDVNINRASTGRGAIKRVANVMKKKNCSILCVRGDTLMLVGPGTMQTTDRETGKSFTEESLSMAQIQMSAHGKGRYSSKVVVMFNFCLHALQRVSDRLGITEPYDLVKMALDIMQKVYTICSELADGDHRIDLGFCRAAVYLGWMDVGHGHSKSRAWMINLRTILPPVDAE